MSMNDTDNSQAVAAPPERKTRRPAKLAGPVTGFFLECAFRVVCTILHIVLRLIVFVKREGPHIPKGPVIIAPNHNSFMDPVVMQMSAWRHLSFMMTEIYYNPLWSRWFFQMWRTIPVKEGRGNRDALEVSIEALRRGWAVCIFPEGSIAKDGKLQKFQSGVAAMAAAANVPVVPVAVVGTFDAFPRHARLPKLWRTIIIRYGEPIPPPFATGEEGARKDVLRAYSERIRDAVEKLQKGVNIK